MRRQNDLEALQGARLPGHITGHPTGLLECEVVAVHSNGTLDARHFGSRSTKMGARYPLWYLPAVGDKVLLAEVTGDERRAVVLQAMSTKTGGAPAHT